VEENLITLLEKWKFVRKLRWKKGGNMLNRKIDNYLREYYQKSGNALLITGARQVGKTYSIREFGKSLRVSSRSISSRIPMPLDCSRMLREAPTY